MVLAVGLYKPAPRFSPEEAKRWPNFTPVELACKCGCGEYWHDPAALDAIQRVRRAVGRLVINSAHRCYAHNKKVGGVAGSQHRQIAFDISTTAKDRQKLLAAARAAGFNGFGYGLTFLHVDQREYAASWDYGQDARAAWFGPAKRTVLARVKSLLRID